MLVEHEEDCFVNFCISAPVNVMFGTRLVITASGSTTLHVYPGQSIQYAIDSAQPGDTIFVHNGTYYENVVVNKAVSLLGENREATIIDGKGTGTVVYIAANNVTISTFTIRHGFARSPYSGIDIYYSSGNNISHNIITGNFYGIHLQYSNNNALASNKISNNNYGIVLHYSSNNTLTLNNASNNLPSFGIVIYSSYNNTVTDNIVTNSYRGIDVSYSDSNTLVGNTVSNNSQGIFLHGSSYNTLVSNTASNNGKANFYVGGVNFSDFNNYVDTSNTVDGKPIYYLMGVVNAFYDAQSNAGTIYLINCNNITIRDLTLTRNYYGVFFWNTTNSKIENVTASNNIYGIYFSRSSNNTIYHNNFVNNTNQVSNYESANTWDDGYPSGGNYWSDYEDRYPNATELDGSSIWDTPYVIDENNQDNYPIVPEFPTGTSILCVFIVLSLVTAIYQRRLLKTPIH